MIKPLKCLLFILCFSSCITPDVNIEKQKYQNQEIHLIPKTTIDLFSEQGQILLSNTTDFNPLIKNWVGQYRMHCGAASAVIVLNSLLEAGGFTQDNFFTPETDKIITRELVYKQGFTLDELTQVIMVRSGLEVSGFHAGYCENQHPYSQFRQDLLNNSEDPGTRIIVLYSRDSVSGTGTDTGHFSPVASYNQNDDMVLILEVGNWKKSFWIGSEDLFAAMHTIDKVCDLHRGWLIVKNKTE